MYANLLEVSARLLRRVKHRHVILPLLALSPLLLTCWTLGAARPPAQFPIDLIPTYVAGKLWLANEVHAVYHASAWLPIEGANPAWLRIAQENRVPLGDTAFTYGPTYLALFLPFIALLPPFTFYWFFATLNSLAALFVGWESARISGVKATWIRWVVATLVAVSFPCSYAAMLGQNVVLAAAIALLALRAFDAERPFAGALLLVLACTFKAWCVLLALALVLGKRWRALVSFVAVYVAVLVVLPPLMFPSALVEGYDRVLRSLPELSVLAFNNVSLRAFIHRISLPDWTPQAWAWSQHDKVSAPHAAVELCVVALVLGAYALLVRRRKPTFSALYTEVMALVLLVLGVCWSHYLVFALPVTVGALLTRELPKAVRILAALSCLWLWRMLAGVAPILPVMRPPALWALVYSAPLLITVLLCLLLAGVRRVASPAPLASTAHD